MQNRTSKFTERSDSFDFDYWRALAEDDPERFEAQRTRLILEFIDASPPALRKRLRGLQWRIDMEIRRSRNAMDGCLRISRMMKDAVYGSGGLLDTLENPLVASKPRAHAGRDAVILPFRPPSGNR